MSKIKVSRRTLMIGAGVVGAGGVGWVLFNDEQRMIRRTLEKHLPDALISNEAITAYTRDFMTLPAFRSDRMRLLLRGVSAANGAASLETWSQLGPGAYQLLQLERGIVTYFVVNSDYLTFDGPGPHPVTYRGLTVACPNPWARYDSHPNGYPEA